MYRECSTSADPDMGRSRCLQHENCGAFDCDTGQHAAAPGAGIDIDAIVTDIDMRDGRMPVHDDLSMIPLGNQKFVANPEQIMLILRMDRNGGAYAGMNEEKIAAFEGVSKTLQEQQMRLRKICAQRPMQFSWHRGSGVEQ